MSRVEKTPDAPTAPDSDVTTEILGVIGLGVVSLLVGAVLYWWFFKHGRHWF